MKNVSVLSKYHYAADWPTLVNQPVEKMNEAGIKYAMLPASSLKEDVLLDILRQFHPYLMKYLHLIVDGSVSQWKAFVNKDTCAMLSLLIPNGGERNIELLRAAAKCLHFAFRGEDNDDIYNTLVTLLIGVINKYDPDYSNKIHGVFDRIDKDYLPDEDFGAKELDEKLDYDVSRCLRHLRSRGFIVDAAEKNRYVRNKENWPPPPKFFQVGVVGFTYYVQQYFRYALQDHITGRSRELESKEGVFQLGFKNVFGETPDSATPHLNGWRDANGYTWAVDTSLMQSEPDVSYMSIEWVNETSDPLFSRIDKYDRYLLYLTYTQEMRQADIAELFCVSVTEVKMRLAALLKQLREMVAAGTKE